jgi:hypothetical protein
VDDKDSSDDEMASNKFVSATSFGARELYSRLLADTASQRKLKSREDFNLPFSFLCDYAYQSDEL